MGRVLFERRSSVFQWTIVIFGVVGCLVCAAMLLHPDSRPAGQVLLLFPAILLLLGLKVPPTRIACRERGIRCSSLTGRRRMLYEEVEQFDPTSSSVSSC